MSEITVIVEPAEITEIDVLLEPGEVSETTVVVEPAEVSETTVLVEPAEITETTVIIEPPIITEITVEITDGRGPAGEDGEDGTDGVDGEDGTDGVDGVDGIDGEGAYEAVFNFAVPSTLWTINHNQNSYGITVFAFDNNDDLVNGYVQYENSNTITIEWYYEMAGYARVFN